MAKVITLKPTPKKSYNPERRPSALLLDQVKHLEWAALPASQRKPEQLKVYKQVKTEWQAAERIAQLTNLIKAAKQALPLQDVALGALPPVVLPPLPPRMPTRAMSPSISAKSGGAKRQRKNAGANKSAGANKTAAGGARRAKAKRRKAEGAKATDAAAARRNSRAKTKTAKAKASLRATRAKGAGTARASAAPKRAGRGKRS